MKKLFVFALCVFSALPLAAQQKSIIGTVKDLVTHTAVESVQISVVNSANSGERYNGVTDAQGNWSLSFVTDVERDLPNVPSEFTLSQNYPNPFNPSTQIRFYAPRQGTAVITVHTLLGQELDRKELQVAAGLSEIEWESKGSAGVLFYSIEFEKTRVTKKMIQLDGGSGRGLGALHTIAGAPQRIVRPASAAEAANYYVIASKFGYETDTTTVQLDVQARADLVIETIHNRAFFIDLHNDILENLIDGYQMTGPRPDNSHQTDLPGMKQGGLDAQMFSVWVDPGKSGYYKWADSLTSLLKSQVAKNPDAIEMAQSASEIYAVAAKKKIAAVIGVEGGHVIENDLSKLIALYNRGMRYLTITWNNSNDWATSAADAASTTKGLTEFGKQVVRTLDSLGVIIDVSHTGVKTIDDILAVTKNPIIASHSGARALNNHTRNLTDAQIRAIAAKGGVIGVVFYPPFLSRTGRATIDSVVKHIDYIKNLVGVDYVAIGSDFDGIGDDVPTGLENVTKYPDLTMALLRKGYTSADVRKILGANYMRVFSSVCK